MFLFPLFAEIVKTTSGKRRAEFENMNGKNKTDSP
jgi:hypothetical protein